MNLVMQNNNSQESVDLEQPSKNLDVKSILLHAKKLLATKQWQTAIDYCKTFLAADYTVSDPSFIPVAILLSQACQQNSQFDEMLLVMEQVNSQGFDHWLVDIRLAECLIYCGKIERAINWLDHLRQQAKDNLQILTKLAELYLHCSQHQKVVECHQTALKLNPEGSQIKYNLAAAKLFLGEIDNAEYLLDQVINNFPGDFDAYYNRSTLKKQTKDKNHIQQLERVFQKNRSQSSAVVSIGYSLAKELEDLRDYEKSFKYLKQAANNRRSKMSYQVQTDVEAMETIKTVFSKKNIDQLKATDNSGSPIFILGLPRSGTTLVDRILSSHDHVGSLGEVSNFAFSLIHTVGPHRDKQDLIKKSYDSDLFELGRRYMKATEGYGIAGRHLIDKTPLNFLYIGLIKRAMPKARLIHLKRHPMDSCYAMYKTLFRMGYPFSYDLGDLAKYYIAYHKLMNHWQDCFGDQILTVEYDQLVESPQSIIQQMQEYCQLPQRTDLIDFHNNISPSSTASAAQVRQPIYKSSVNKWKFFPQQLKFIKNKLISAGICFD